MSIAFVNGEFVPLHEARVSPMDRGFLFGDGIYEVVPSYNGKMVAINAHLHRLERSAAELGLPLERGTPDWQELCQTLVERNGAGNLGIYLQVTRGVEWVRRHEINADLKPTVFAYCFDIPPEPSADPEHCRRLSLSSMPDGRWHRCDIKSVALLGNVMHLKQGHDKGADEVLLYNENQELTEAASGNLFVVKDNRVMTPELDSQLLPGVTRGMLIDMLAKHRGVIVEECKVPMSLVRSADELWFTSSSKEIVPVVELDQIKVGKGQPGPNWQAAQALYNLHKYDY